MYQLKFNYNVMITGGCNQVIFKFHLYYYYYYYINYCAEINADYSAQVYYIVCIYLDYYKSDQGFRLVISDNLIL